MADLMWDRKNIDIASSYGHNLNQDGPSKGCLRAWLPQVSLGDWFKRNISPLNSGYMTTLFASVELGSPAADCNHYGICSVDLLPLEQWEPLEPAHFRHVKALLSLAKGGALFLQIPLTGIRPDTFLAFFPPEGFRVDSAKVLPDEITGALGLPQGASTLPGLYSWRLADGLLSTALLLATVEQQILRAA